MQNTPPPSTKDTIVLETTGHYISYFLQVDTTEEHRPSLKGRDLPKGHGCPFNPSAQTAKNVGSVIQCEECEKWRCLHAARKLTRKTRDELEAHLDTILYSCGSVLGNVEAAEEGSDLMNVYVRANLDCQSQIELTYYSTGFEDICIHCGTVDKLVKANDTYPYCENCSSKATVRRRGRKFTPRSCTVLYFTWWRLSCMHERTRLFK